MARPGWPPTWLSAAIGLLGCTLWLLGDWLDEALLAVLLVAATAVVSLAVAEQRKRRVLAQTKERWQAQREADKAYDTRESFSTEWINTVARSLWPAFLEQYVSRIVREQVQKKLDSLSANGKLPNILARLEMEEFTLGTTPPTITSARMHNTPARSYLQAEFSTHWVASAFHVVLCLHLRPSALLSALKARFEVCDISVRGRVLLGCRLASRTPGVTGLDFSFAESPEVDINLRPLGLAVGDLPGIATWLNDLLVKGISKLMVEPKRVFIPLERVLLRMAARKAGGPGGLLTLTLISAKDLHAALPPPASTSNAFCEVRFLGRVLRTHSVQDSINPGWNRSFAIPLPLGHFLTRGDGARKGLRECCKVSSRDSCGHCEIRIRLLDCESTGDQVSLGSCEVDLEADWIKIGEASEDTWIPLTGVTTGALLVRVTVVPLPISQGRPPPGTGLPNPLPPNQIAPRQHLMVSTKEDNDSQRALQQETLTFGGIHNGEIDPSSTAHAKARGRELVVGVGLESGLEVEKEAGASRGSGETPRLRLDSTREEVKEEASRPRGGSARRDHTEKELEVEARASTSGSSHRLEDGAKASKHEGPQPKASRRGVESISTVPPTLIGLQERKMGFEDEIQPVRSKMDVFSESNDLLNVGRSVSAPEGALMSELQTPPRGNVGTTEARFSPRPAGLGDKFFSAASDTMSFVHVRRALEEEVKKTRRAAEEERRKRQTVENRFASMTQALESAQKKAEDAETELVKERKLRELREDDHKQERASWEVKLVLATARRPIAVAIPSTTSGGDHPPSHERTPLSTPSEPVPKAPSLLEGDPSSKGGVGLRDAAEDDKESLSGGSVESLKGGSLSSTPSGSGGSARRYGGATSTGSKLGLGLGLGYGSAVGTRTPRQPSLRAERTGFGAGPSRTLSRSRLLSAASEGPSEEWSEEGSSMPRSSFSETGRPPSLGDKVVLSMGEGGSESSAGGLGTSETGNRTGVTGAGDVVENGEEGSGRAPASAQSHVASGELLELRLQILQLQGQVAEEKAIRAQAERIASTETAQCAILQSELDKWHLQLAEAERRALLQGALFVKHGRETSDLRRLSCNGAFDTLIWAPSDLRGVVLPKVIVKHVKMHHVDKIESGTAHFPGGAEFREEKSGNIVESVMARKQSRAVGNLSPEACFSVVFQSHTGIASLNLEVPPGGNGRSRDEWVHALQGSVDLQQKKQAANAQGGDKREQWKQSLKDLFKPNSLSDNNT